MRGRLSLLLFLLITSSLLVGISGQKAYADQKSHYFTLEGGTVHDRSDGHRRIRASLVDTQTIEVTVRVDRWNSLVFRDQRDAYWRPLIFTYKRSLDGPVELGEKRALRTTGDNKISSFNEGEFTLQDAVQHQNGGRRHPVPLDDIHLTKLSELTSSRLLSWESYTATDSLLKISQNRILLQRTADGKLWAYFTWWDRWQGDWVVPKSRGPGNGIETVIELLYAYTSRGQSTGSPSLAPVEVSLVPQSEGESTPPSEGESTPPSEGESTPPGPGEAVTSEGDIPDSPPPVSKGLAEALEDQTFFVRGTWQITRGIINILLIIALIVIAFSNIVRLNIDTYVVKKALPNLILGVILANASYLIIRYLVDLTTAVTYFFVNLAESSDFSGFIIAAGETIGIDTILTVFNLIPVGGSLVNAVASVASVFLAIIFAIISAVALVWLAFLLYFRLVAIYLLTILSPLAFVAYGIPGLEKYFKMWWQQMIKWLFMLPAMTALLWLMIRISGEGGESIAKIILMYLLLFTALTLPTKWGGAVIDKASGVFKKGVTAAYGGSQSFGLQAGLWGRSLAEKDNPALKGLGKVLQHGGHVIASPTALKQGLKRRMEGVAKGREYEMKQGWAYKRAAGGQARFMDKYSKAMEDYRGLDAKSLAQIMTGFDPDTGENKNQKMLDWLGKLSILERHRFLTTDFNAWRTTNKKGLPASEEEMADFAAAARLFNTESLRRTQKVGGVEALFDAGWDFDQFKKNQVAAASSASSPYGDVGSPINTSIATEIEERLKKGHLAETISNEISQKYGLDKLTALGAVNDINLALRLRPLIEHFRPDPGLAQSIAKMGAELGEEFEEALAKNTDPAFEQVIERGREFLHKAGASIGFSADIPGQTNFDQVSELQRRVAEVTRAAHSASMGYSAETSTKIANVFNQTGFRLGELAPDGGPAVAATHFQNDQQAQTVINNHIVSQAKAQNVLLNPNQVQQISQTLKTDLIQELSNNKTLTRIFGSEKFRQKIIEAVSNAQPNIDVIAPQPGDARPNEPQYTQQQPPTQ